MLEAMASGCLLVAGDTAPVHEMLEPRRDGLSVAPLDSAATAAALLDALGDKTTKGMRIAARERVQSRLSRIQGQLQMEGLLKTKPRVPTEGSPAPARIASIRSWELLHG